MFGLNNEHTHCVGYQKGAYPKLSKCALLYAQISDKGAKNRGSFPRDENGKQQLGLHYPSQGSRALITPQFH